MRSTSTVTRWLCGVVLVVAGVGCGPEGFVSGQGGPAGWQGDVGAPDAGPARRDGAPGYLYGDVGTVAPRDDTSCGGQAIAVEVDPKTPDLYLVVDRSDSMSMPIELFNFFGPSKWAVMKKTVSAVVSSFGSKIRFGLSLYPGDDQCAAGTEDVALALGNGAVIDNALGKGVSKGYTPTHTTLAQAQQVLTSQPSASGGSYVLLATDGIPNCRADPGDDSEAETLAAVKSLNQAGIKTFVVGFGDVIAGNPGLLDALAQMGGVPNPSGPHQFYPAASEAELKQAMFNIALGIVPPVCTYALKGSPPDPDNVTVTFNGQPIPRTLGNADGWNYSGTGDRITFYGKACDQLQQANSTDIAFVFGCKGPEIN